MTTSITITMSVFEIRHTCRVAGRPFDAVSVCHMSIEGDVIEAPWHVCMDEITRRFPGVEFSTSWCGSICTIVPTEVQHVYTEDPECPLFFMEVSHG